MNALSNFVISNLVGFVALCVSLIAIYQTMTYRSRDLALEANRERAALAQTLKSMMDEIGDLRAEASVMPMRIGFGKSSAQDELQRYVTTLARDVIKLRSQLAEVPTTHEGAGRLRAEAAVATLALIRIDAEGMSRDFEKARLTVKQLRKTGQIG